MGKRTPIRVAPVGAAAITDSTTVGRALITLADPSAVTWLRVNADNTVTPLNAANTFAALKQAASDTATGVVELATDAESRTGTSTALAVTPANLTARRRASRVSAQFDKTNTSLANITGLTADVAAAGTYGFRAVLIVNADATGGYKFAIAGTATATAIIARVTAQRDDTSSFTISARLTSLGSSTGIASGTALLVIIEGSIEVNAAGTLVPQFAQNAANGTSSILVGSTWEVFATQ